MGFLLFGLGLWLPCAVFSGVVAEDKGHNGIAWFWGGLLFGPVGLLAIAALSDRTQRRYLRLLVESQGIDLKSSQSSGDAEDLDEKMQGH